MATLEQKLARIRVLLDEAVRLLDEIEAERAGPYAQLDVAARQELDRIDVLVTSLIVADERGEDGR